MKQVFGEFEPGELERLLAEGERSGKPILARVVFKELSELAKRAMTAKSRTGSRGRLPMSPLKKRS